MAHYKAPSPLLLVLSLCFAAPPALASTPTNGWVVWASNRKDGRHEIYLMQSDGSNVKRLTFNGGRFPGWSPDGKWIAYTATKDETTHVMRWNGSGDKQVCDGPFEFWLWDGSGLVCRKTDEHYRVDPDSGANSLLFKKSDFSQLGSKLLNPGGLTHDGRWLVAHSDIFRSGFSASNGSFKAYHAAVILDMQDKSKLYYFGNGCEPTTPPTGDLVYHVCGGGPCASFPDPYRMSLKDIASRSSYEAEIAHDNADWGHEYFPRISNDNKWLVYGATTGCHDHETCDYEIWVHKLGAGSADRTRITNDPSNDQWPHLWVGTLPDLGCATDADCDDGDPCTVDSCETTSTACSHKWTCATEAGAGPTEAGADPVEADAGPASGDGWADLGPSAADAGQVGSEAGLPGDDAGASGWDAGSGGAALSAPLVGGCSLAGGRAADGSPLALLLAAALLVLLRCS